MSRSLASAILAIVLLAAAGPAAGRDALYAVVSRGTPAIAVGDSGRVLRAAAAPHVAWSRVSSILTTPLRSVTTSALTFVAVGDEGRMVRSSDATGLVWFPLTERTNRDLFGISHTVNSLIGIAVGDSGVILRSATSSLEGWSLVENVPTRKALRSVAGGTLYSVAVGDSGTILWGPAGGASWTRASVVPTQNDLLGVAEGPGPSGTPRFWAVGRGGVLLRSVPNAQTWESLVSGTTQDLHAIVFFGQTGVAVGAAGTILYSNGGQTWSIADPPTDRDLFGISYCGSGAGGRFVAVGDENTILTSVLGLVWDDAVVPARRTSWGGLRGGWGPAPPRGPR